MLILRKAQGYTGILDTQCNRQLAKKVSISLNLCQRRPHNSAQHGAFSAPGLNHSTRTVSPRLSSFTFLSNFLQPNICEAIRPAVKTAWVGLKPFLVSSWGILPLALSTPQEILSVCVNPRTKYTRCSYTGDWIFVLNLVKFSLCR